jgi:hypothetical protein
MTAQVIRLCQGRVVTGLHHASRCRSRARWWVGRPHSQLSDALAVCGTHSRAYTARWPILSDDPQADRQALEDTFR